MADKDPQHVNKLKVQSFKGQIKDWQKILDSGKFKGKELDASRRKGFLRQIEKANEKIAELNEEITGISYKGANFNLTKAQMGKLRWIKGFTGRTPTTVLSRVKPIDEAITEGNTEKAEKLIRSFKKDYPEFASMKFGKTKPTKKTPQDIDTVSTNTTGENRAYRVVGSKKNEPSKPKPTPPKPKSRPTRKGPGEPVTDPDKSLAGSELGTLAGSIKKDLDGEIASKNVDGRKLAKVMRDNSGTGKGDPSSSPDTSSFRKVSGPDGWEQGKRVYKTPFGNITVDSTDEGMWGKGKTSEDAADLKKGGTAKKKKAVSKYGAKTMKFTNRGGMYKVKR
tara:strand:- start:4411 stop:5418 length:1008 start_codon:yes stop_codon:yes gene_type:complete